MGLELDHVFVCVNAGAPEADRLIQFGLREGPSNQHAGQGTANRRFFFANAMIELLFVNDASEAQSPPARRTRLWERWQGRDGGASPFGICVRPTDPCNAEPPFPAWEYRPAYLPDSRAMQIAESDVDEPMWVYLSFARRADYERRFLDHPVGVRQITGLELTTPAPLASAAAAALVRSGVLSIRMGTQYRLDVEFDRKQRHEVADFRPYLPLVLRL